MGERTGAILARMLRLPLMDKRSERIARVRVAECVGALVKWRVARVLSVMQVQ